VQPIIGTTHCDKVAVSIYPPGVATMQCFPKDEHCEADLATAAAAAALIGGSVTEGAIATAVLLEALLLGESFLLVAAAVGVKEHCVLLSTGRGRFGGRTTPCGG
jgi:hypothetical protein